MALKPDSSAETRTQLNRDRVLRAAVDFADKHSIEALSMRKLGSELGVEAMSLYNHVDNKEDLVDGMLDVILGEIELSSHQSDWRVALHQQSVSARSVHLLHPWAASVIQSQTTMTPMMLKYIDSIISILRNGGLSLELTHHAMHALGSRMMGFSHEPLEKQDSSDKAEALLRQQISAGEYPNMAELMAAVDNDGNSIVAAGCDAQVEFEFGLDLILDGLESLRLQAL